jgi:cytochrome P450
MELGRHPEVVARLQAEIATVMPKEPLTGSKLAAGSGAQQQSLRHGDQKLLSALCGLEYLNCCIKEAMRLWPVASIGSVRQLDKDMHWRGMLLPKGSSIRAHVFSMFRESWIDRPTEFLPERWSPENPQLPELKEMFIPFSLGKRACIGQNMAMFQLRIVAAYFLHNFDFTLVGEPDFEYFITLKPVDLFLSVKDRVQ